MNGAWWNSSRHFSLLREGLINTIADEKQMPRLNVYRDQIVWGRSPVRIDLAGGMDGYPPLLHVCRW